MKRVLIGLIVVLAALPARADWVEYAIPNLPGLVMLIPAREVKAQSGGVYTITTDAGLILHVRIHDVLKVYKSPSVSAKFDVELRKALATKRADEVLNTAKWALQRGLIKEFHHTVDKVLEMEPTNAEAKRLVELRQRIDKGCVESSKQEGEMRKLVRNPNMKFKLSKHFLLLHDTPDTPDERTRKTRAEVRLELLERVYEAFLFKFYSQGVELEIPKEHLKVVLFNNRESYLAFATRLGPQMASTAGFYEHTTNTSVFYDQGSHKEFDALKKLDLTLQDLAKRATGPDKGDLVNTAKAIRLLLYVMRESQDVEVVSHEATHQLAANTGLLPRYVAIPSWVHEGLATYFEAPSDSTWAGFGAVNEQRLQFYKLFANRRTRDGTEVSSIDFIVGDQVFDYARSNGAILNGYAQAWALTHFLMERHFDRFMLFYKKLGDMPPDVHLSPEVLNNIFNDVFKEQRRDLQSEWRQYMSSLQTEKQKVLGDRW
jgi:Protein of unknown function (DUF1570)